MRVLWILKRWLLPQKIGKGVFMIDFKTLAFLQEIEYLAYCTKVGIVPFSEYKKKGEDIRPVIYDDKKVATYEDALRYPVCKSVNVRPGHRDIIEYYGGNEDDNYSVFAVKDRASSKKYVEIHGISKEERYCVIVEDGLWYFAW